MRPFALFLMLGLAANACAEGGIATDRPDFTESPEVVAAGTFQIETSVAWQRDKAGGTTTRLRSTPTLLRLGIGHELELRLETDGWLHQSDGTAPAIRGRADTAVGVKWQVWDAEETGGQPSLGWLLHVDTPSGSGPFKGQGLRPSLRLAVEWALPAGWSLGTMAGIFTSRDDNNQRYSAAVASASLAIPINESWHTFAELGVPQWAGARHGGKVVTLNTGLAYLVSPDLQLDAAVFRGVNKNAPDWAWTVGVSARF